MIVCDRPTTTIQCYGHYFENELTRGLDFCDGSSFVRHSDGSRWHYAADGTEARLTPDENESSVQP